MTTPDRDRRIAEWARGHAAELRAHENVMVNKPWKCAACQTDTIYAELCASCLEHIAECVEGRKDGTNIL